MALYFMISGSLVCRAKSTKGPKITLSAIRTSAIETRVKLFTSKTQKTKTQIIPPKSSSNCHQSVYQAPCQSIFGDKIKDTNLVFTTS